MKKYIALILSILVVVSLTSCGSASENASVPVQNQENAAESGSVESAVLEPESSGDDSLAGEYRCISSYTIEAGKEYDNTDALENGWADKSYYLYLIIEPNDGYYDYILFKVKDGVESRIDYFLDPKTLMVHHDHLFSDPGSPIEIGEDGSIIVSEKTGGMVFVKSDEIPH